MERTRGRPSEKFLISPILTRNAPGPSIVLRPAFPYVPAAGTAKAAVLNQRAIEGSEIVIGAPVRLARRVPLTPRATSVTSPTTRAVKGAPDSAVTVPVQTQPPRTLASQP